MNMAQKLTALRKEKSLTQMELAEKLEVSRQAVSKWELGTALPGTYKLKAISDLYGVSVDYLLDENQEQYQPIVPSAPMAPVRQGRDKLLLVLCVGILAVIIVMAIALVILVNEKVDEKLHEIESIPIGEMTIVNEREYLDDYHDDGTFSFKEY